jgi:hypothetical protein
METHAARRTPSSLRALCASLLLAAGVLGRPAAAAPPPVETLTFPGCGTTVQDCIEDAPEGALVQLATNGPIDQALTIEKSLQLRAAPGFRPVFTPFSYIYARAVVSDDRHLVLQGLTWQPAGSSGVIIVAHDTDGTFEVEILDNAFLGITGASSGALVTVRTEGSPNVAPGPLALTLRGNRFEVPNGAETNPVSISLITPVDGTVLVAENLVRTGDVRQTAAIDFYHTGGRVEIDVVRNIVISGNPSESGVQVRQNAIETGRTVARVAGNLLIGFNGGMRFGAEFYASEGTIELAVLHNTIVHAGLRAVQVGGREDQGGAASGLIANNVLAFSGRSDVGIHEFEATVVERRNLLTYIDPTDAPAAPGPESIVAANPEFVGNIDFRLAATSPGVNTAAPALVPADLTVDLDGWPRLAGPAADMGAYELPCEPGSTEAHCVMAPTCQETGCATDDPCYPALCVNDQCVTVEPTGFERARCVCARPLPASCASTPLPLPLVKKPAKACAQLGRAATSTAERQVRRFLSSARRAWDQSARAAVRRAAKGTLAPECAAALEADWVDASARVEYLLAD